MRPKLKVCCIQSVKEAEIAVQNSADILGLVGQMPSGPGVVDDLLIAEIVQSTPEHISTFLLTSESSVSGIIQHWRRTRTSHIQIVRPLSIEIFIELTQQLPEIPLVGVVHMLNQLSEERAREIEPYCDFLLLDSGNPSAPSPTLGGTGNTHNWEISKRIAQNSTKPIFLAGGLSASNVQDAVVKVNPHGIDVCSSVRRDNKLNELALSQFVSRLNPAEE